MFLPQMQQVSAFSRPQTVPSVPASLPKRNPWILSSWRDLILYVGPPLLLVPMFALAQARNPKSGRLHNNFAMFLAKECKLDQAIFEFRLAISHDPKHPPAHYHLGRALYLKGDLDGAHDRYEQTTRLDPKSAGA